MIHLIGASVAGAAMILALASRPLPAIWIGGLSVYAVGLVAVFGFSAAYNLVHRPRLKAAHRRCDHAAIFLKIAATYTPIVLVKMATPTGYGLLALVGRSRCSGSRPSSCSRGTSCGRPMSFMSRRAGPR